MTWTMKMKPYAKWIVALVFTCAVLMQAICIAKADEPKADTMAPALQAEIKENKLQIKVTDDHSGVAGVQVNGMLFTTMQDEILTIDLTDVLGKYEHLSIRAFDYAGNFCEPVKLDNPCFEVVATPTIVPTNTPKPTKNPVKDDVSVDSTTTPRITTAPTLKPFGNSVVYVNDWATNTVQPQPVATATPAVEYITLGPGMPFQSEGNGHTLDMLYSAATNKQFISMQTKSGNTFYLVIDYDKPIDEDAEL